jgi:Bacterial protein of unknown function (DUF899)
MTTGMKTPRVVSEREWEAAWQQLLLKEKELTRSRDALAAERRRMPWMAVEKTYEFDGPNGKVSLLDLFEGRRRSSSTAPSTSRGSPPTPRGPNAGTRRSAVSVARSSPTRSRTPLT